MKKFANALTYVEGKGLKITDVTFDEKIISVTDKKLKADVIQLPPDAIVLPGFIDQHTHGGGGSDGMDGANKDIRNIAETAAKEGTTTFLVTTMTQSVDNVTTALKAVKQYRSEPKSYGARVEGVHLEGPFIAPSHKGAQPLEYIASPKNEVFDKYNEASGNCIKIVTLAPEIEGMSEFIKHLHENGVVASIGHSSAKVTDVENAINAGASNVTHTYNAQSALHHREIGVVGSAMLYDELNCEVIADTIHVSVPALKLLVKNKPHDKISLITDSMRAKGLPDGESELGGQKVFVSGGEARLADGTLAGSTLKMNVAIKNMVEKVGLSLTDAVDLATLNPARMLNILDVAGSIKEGKRADFAVIDKDFNVLMTIRDGEIIYKA